MDSPVCPPQIFWIESSSSLGSPLASRSWQLPRHVSSCRRGICGGEALFSRAGQQLEGPTTHG